MTSEFKLAPSILSADFSDLKLALSQCEEGGAHWIHIDVMDNQFVPNLTIGPPVVKSLRPKTNKFLDVHMMVIEPEKLVEPFAKAGADLITFHIEATDDPDSIIDLIRSAGAQVGISIKPSTSLSEIEPYYDKIDLILVMSVEPGFGGQGYIEESTDRIRKIKKRLTEDEKTSLWLIGNQAITFEKKQFRIYPQKNLFSHVIGQIDEDNMGISGVEKFFDNQLKREKFKNQPLNLTLDSNLQYLIRN